MDYYELIKKLIDGMGITSVDKKDTPTHTVHSILLKNNLYLHIALENPFLIFGWGKFCVKYNVNYFEMNSIVQKYKLKKYIESVIEKHYKSIFL